MFVSKQYLDYKLDYMVQLFPPNQKIEHRSSPRTQTVCYIILLQHSDDLMFVYLIRDVYLDAKPYYELALAAVTSNLYQLA